MPPSAAGVDLRGDSASVAKCILAFDTSNRLALLHSDGRLHLPIVGFDDAAIEAALAALFPAYTTPLEYFSVSLQDVRHRVFFTQVHTEDADDGLTFLSFEQIEHRRALLDPLLAAILPQLECHLIDIPYLHLGENDFIYKFRPEKERNSAIYQQDSAAAGLYQSKLCSAIKAHARRFERTAADPVLLDFGAVRYVLPSHFGFCLGVKNAIERAYETLAENPGRRVFMLSELIHNPFVNDDLSRRGLRYLQTDKGVPLTTSGRPTSAAPGEPLLWDGLTPDDIVIIPAFGATDEDKRRLVRKGIAVCQYDATCMLVEKVWKAARAYGRAGFTVVIHGKHEHEETKATFSNTRRYAPAVIVRNLEEAQKLGRIVASEDIDERRSFYSFFAGRHTPDFDIERHLEKIAVVNQTTLLMNETLSIIEHLRGVYANRYGDPQRVGGDKRNDTLCYATQVNQDALSRALTIPLDAAFVIGGKNSSNTFQLYRLCEDRLREKAFFIQSEESILSHAEVSHYIFPAKNSGVAKGVVERRLLWPGAVPIEPKTILVTGGASCPDGIIQQVINRINQLFPQQSLRDIDSVIAELENGA